MNNKPLLWHTERRRVNDLLPNPKNPRELDDRQRDALMKSLKQFGLAEIPAINTDNQILAGHQRVKVLQLLGRGEEMIDVRIPSRPLTKKEADTYLLTSNAVHGSWSFDLLREFPSDLLLDIGFDPAELNDVFDNILATEDDHFDVEKEIKKIQKPTVKPGELYALGNHRLICADARQEAVVRRLVGNAKIDLVDVDPPFNISLAYKGTKGQYGGSYKDKLPEDEYRAFLDALIKNSLAVCKENAHIFFWSDQRYLGLIYNLFRDNKIELRRTLLWVKGGDNPTPQVAWNKSYEPCTYGTIGRPYLAPRVTQFNEFMNRELSNGARLLDEISDIFDLWLVRRLAGSEYEHAAQKPNTLYEKPLRRCSRPGDNVLDLTAGSGSIMVACEQMKRRAFLAEVDPIFATLIIKRYEKLTNKKAKRIS
jgi:site-specific DNA-methyltransferase (adenine-specific)